MFDTFNSLAPLYQNLLTFPQLHYINKITQHRAISTLKKARQFPSISHMNFHLEREIIAHETDLSVNNTALINMFIPCPKGRGRITSNSVWEKRKRRWREGIKKNKQRKLTCS